MQNPFPDQPLVQSDVFFNISVLIYRIRYARARRIAQRAQP